MTRHSEVVTTIPRDNFTCSQYPFGPGALVDMEIGNRDSSRAGVSDPLLKLFRELNRGKLASAQETLGAHRYSSTVCIVLPHYYSVPPDSTPV
ncbi:hypothetical protein HGM15179_008713 [Zosterops borbonicus]|uniref:Uncharacterized protein n=1 Tax=Zosterops borbonicus TaxID=364589 RepID=A0A8K1LLU8_9PASS|nr:hypothetical protein HGM15179_008713 [Zosterops borbonicus]